MGAQRDPSLVRGERNGNTKVTDLQVAALRARVAAGERPTTVGRSMGICASQSCRIANGQARRVTSGNASLE